MSNSIQAQQLHNDDSHTCTNDYRVSCSECRLGSLCLPIAVTTDQVDQIDAIIQRSKPLGKGDHIFQQGDKFRSVYAVRSGAIKAYTLTDSGKEQITGFYLPGEILGMDGIGTFSHSASARAIERSAVCEIPYDSLGTLSAQLPSLQSHFFQIMSQEINNDQKLIGMLGKNSAEERIAAFLLSLSTRNLRRKFSATEFRIPMSRTDIANYLGLTIETVSRIFTRLQKNNVIAIDYKELSILDMQKLRELSGASST